MAEAFVELGAEGVNYVTENHWDKIHDTVAGAAGKVKNSVAPGANNNSSNDNRRRSGGQVNYSRQERYNPDYYRNDYDYGGASAVSGNTQNTRRRQRNRLPSPEGDAYRKENYRDRRRSPSLDRESEYSEQVIGAYEQERDDRSRAAESVLSKKDLKKLRRDSKMSYGQGYGNGNLSTAPRDARPHSAQPPRTRYYDDDDEYGSDYDDRTGKRHSTTGRGYEDDRYDDRGYDREIIETERYRGVSQALVVSIATSPPLDTHLANISTACRRL